MANRGPGRSPTTLASCCEELRDYVKFKRKITYRQGDQEQAVVRGAQTAREAKEVLGDQDLSGTEARRLGCHTQPKMGRRTVA